ncbi:glutamyl-tRNA(Gln) amidotransferase subunit D [Candidatus Micrarchaeota archaeon RBG_16_49_10]|nr:MAG: glutamyl-tRNA(Gln) amidotransferase subunit D [Candidatus Micrarchaeota archaeon RBG_16_49_10]
MYSEQILAVLKKMKVKVGDRVNVTKGKEIFEGVLMPRIEVGDQDTLSIKLNSGYNVGLRFDRSVNIERVGDGPKLGSIPALKLKESKELPSISMISTGGTIGTHVDYKTGGVFMCRSPEEILSTAPEIQSIVNLKNIIRPFTLASEDMLPSDWQKMAELSAKELNKDVEGIIITHGTDVLHYTSYAMSFMLKNLTKPIAIVGAQRSPDRGSFDGAMNLICAAHFIGHSDVAEVCVVMHGSSNDDYCLAHRGTKVRKMHTSRRDAFRSINDIPLLKIWPNGKIETLNSNYRKKSKGKVVADTKFEPKVSLVKAYVGSDPEIIDWHVKRGFKGIVVEGTGLGHVPTGESGITKDPLRKKYSWIPHIKSAVDSGVAVVMTSQAMYGRVNPYVYRNLRLASNAGTIFGEDMLPEAAYVKLGWVLGHTKNLKKVRELMAQNLAGEINKRLDTDLFLI